MLNLFSFIGRRKKVFCLIFIVSLLTILAPQVADAGLDDIWNTLKSLPISIPLMGIAYVFKGMAILQEMVAGIFGGFMMYVLGGDFIHLSYTNPATNPIIDVGLSVTQGLANIVIILTLVYIALATILGLGGYETKKLIIRFVLIALLVNFTPVICGLVVDPANIILGFFLSDAALDEPGGHSTYFGWVGNAGKVEDSWRSGQAKEKRRKWKNPLFQLAIRGEIWAICNIIVGYVFLIIYYVIATLLYIIYTLLFLVRYVIIWILVILSPLAFVCLILPKGSRTRAYWNYWWNHFFQWVTVGVWAGFFLYLGKRFSWISSEPEHILQPGAAPQDWGVVMTFLPAFFALIFIIIGFFFTLILSATGASAITRGITGTYKKLGGKMGRGAKRRVIHNRATRKAAGRIVSGVQKVPFLRHAIPEGLRKVAETKPSLKEEQKQIDYMSSTNIAKAASPGKFKTGRPLTKERATAGLLTVLSRGDADDWLKVAKERYGAEDTNELFGNKKFRKETASLMKTAQSGGELNAIARGDPRFAEIAFAHGIGGYKKDSKKGINTKEDAIKKAVNEARVQHIKNWDPGTLKDPAVAEAAMQKFDKNRWLKINDEVKGGQDAALEGIDRAYTNFLTGHQKDLSGKSPEEKKNEYKEYLKRKNGEAEPRYFKALDDKSKRMEQTGWREPEERREGEAPSTPGEAAGIILTSGAEFEAKHGKKKPAGRSPKGPPSGRKPSGNNAKGRKASRSKPPKGKK